MHADEAGARTRLHWLMGGPDSDTAPAGRHQRVRQVPDYGLTAFPYLDLCVAPLRDRYLRPDMQWLHSTSDGEMVFWDEMRFPENVGPAVVQALEDPVFPFWLPVEVTGAVTRPWLLAKMQRLFAAQILACLPKTPRRPPTDSILPLHAPPVGRAALPVLAPHILQTVLQACLRATVAAPPPTRAVPALPALPGFPENPPRSAPRLFAPAPAAPVVPVGSYWQETPARVPTYCSAQAADPVRCYLGIPYLFAAYPGYAQGRWNQVGDLGLLTVDVLLTMLAHWWTHWSLWTKGEPWFSPTWIDAATLLAAGGHPPQVVDGERRQHRILQVIAIARTVKLLSHLWVEVDQVPVRRPDGRRIPNGRVREPLFVFYDFQVQQRSPREVVPYQWLYTPGRWIAAFCDTVRHPLGWVDPALLRLNRATRPWAKRIGYYLTFQLNGAKEADPCTIQEILEGTGLRHPRRERTKQFQRRAFTTALQQLQAAQIIKTWEAAPPIKETTSFAAWLDTKITVVGPKRRA